MTHQLQTTLSELDAAKEKATAATRLASTSAAIAEQMDRHVASSSADAEHARERAAAAEASLEECVRQRRELQMDGDRLRAQLLDQSQAASLKQRRLEDDVASLRSQLQQSLLERDQLNYAHDETKADAYAMKKQLEATLALTKAQLTKERQEVSAEADHLKEQLIAAMDGEQSLRGRLETVAAEATANRLASEQDRSTLLERVRDTEAALERERAEQKSSLKRFSALETSLEHDISVLLQRVDELQASNQQLLAALDDKDQLVRHHEDVARVLAVKVKSLQADDAAREMEAETKMLLVQQNDDLERQLADLRRVVASVMARKP